MGSGGDIKLDCMSIGFLRVGCDMVVETIALIEVGGYGWCGLVGEFVGRTARECEFESMEESPKFTEGNRVLRWSSIFHQLLPVPVLSLRLPRYWPCVAIRV